MTRDSKFWWLVMACSVMTAVSSRMDLIDPLLPAQHTDKVHAIIELLALIVGIVGGKMSASPINNISDEAREKYLDAKYK
jgi:hypothetical protein